MNFASIVRRRRWIGALRASKKNAQVNPNPNPTYKPFLSVTTLPLPGI